MFSMAFAGFSKGARMGAIRAISFVVGLWALICATPVVATCAGVPGWTGDWSSGPSGTILVPSNTPIGTRFATYSGVMSNKVYAFCSYGQTDTMNVWGGGYTATAVPGYTGMWTYSNTPGIGFIFKENGTVIAGRGNSYPVGPGGRGGNYYYYSGAWSVELYKIGDFDRVAAWIMMNQTLGTSGTNYLRRLVAIQSVPATCSVQTSNITIPLGDVNANSFPSVGSVSNRSPNFNINLNCSYSPSVYMSIGGVSVPGNANLFGLTGGSATAGGIAVQLFRAGTQVIPGQRTLLTSAAGATLSVPVAANYYRTGAITPGTANAHMVATFTYN